MDMIKKVREDREGFTLAELLIVVAIILVLVAVAIPVFTGALNKADDAVKNADIRAVKAAATTEILLNKSAEDLGKGPWTATAHVDGNGNVGKVTIADGAGTDSATKADDGYDVTVGITATDVQ